MKRIGLCTLCLCLTTTLAANEPAATGKTVEVELNRTPDSVTEPEAAASPSATHHAHHARDRSSRFLTSRKSPIDLPLPEEKDAFFFAVYGDRTGGSPEGIAVLKQAVTDTNLLAPDMVMTVGDMIQGYNTTPIWMAQMKEFKGVMNKLDCPWFPVAGNHDVYWRGPKKPEGEHEKNYEMHFGPLWYAFEHKDCWFICLYSDEGDPNTGEKTFSKPGAQTMSPEQFKWLDDTLKKTANAKHVFVFLHHPRWHQGGYGDDWSRVHKRLVESGNVRVVFAGHEHRMVYDGKKDGIEYVCLATVGGHQKGTVPAAGWLHHLDIVTVRDDRISIAALPVGEVMDVRKITQEVNRETVTLANTQPVFDGLPQFSAKGTGSDRLKVTFRNPTSRPIDITVQPDSADSRWITSPDHKHGRIEAGESLTMEFLVIRTEPGFGDGYRPLELVTQRDYLAKGLRVPLPDQRSLVPLRIKFPTPPPPKADLALITKGNDALSVPAGAIPLANGAFTLEGWFNPAKLNKRTGLVTKTESSEYGIFVIDGKPRFDVHLNGKYVSAIAPAGSMKAGQWQHVAGVFDGKELRLYIDGRLVASEQGSGKRTTNGLPLVIGGDVDRTGQPTSYFIGKLDEVRLSSNARYSGESFEPARRMESDKQTKLLLHFDGKVDRFHIDSSEALAHPREVGSPMLAPAG